jgi:hypothetical protein
MALGEQPDIDYSYYLADVFAEDAWEGVDRVFDHLRSIAADRSSVEPDLTAWLGSGQDSACAILTTRWTVVENVAHELVADGVVDGDRLRYLLTVR